jgi:enoyl-CoA hydratase
VGVLADLRPPDRPMTVLLEREEPVVVIRLNRPEALNALSNQLMSELVGALENLDDDEAVRCIVLAGDEKAFASGADIGDLSDPTHLELYFGGRIDKWDAIRSVRTPIVAAVSGYCLGGGCELAMACDLIVASETAQFGQPETNLGVLPGAGGTQRLTRAIGKAKAMDMILTGRFLSAREAEAAGLVARVVAAEAWLDEAKRVAHAVAAKSPIGVRQSGLRNEPPRRSRSRAQGLPPRTLLRGCSGGDEGVPREAQARDQGQVARPRARRGRARRASVSPRAPSPARRIRRSARPP